MKFFVQIIGPYDVTVVGPFETVEMADAFKKTLPLNFDSYILTEGALDANFIEFGPMSIESPNRFVDDNIDWLKAVET